MLTIIVADDDPALRDIVRSALEPHGHIVYEAVDGYACDDLIESLHPDAVVLDVFMPNRDGIEVMTRWRGRAGAPHFICVSGGQQLRGLDILKLAWKLGADATLYKPFRPSELLETLTSTMKKSQCLAS